MSQRTHFYAFHLGPHGQTHIELLICIDKRPHVSVLSNTDTDVCTYHPCHYGIPLKILAASPCFDARCLQSAEAYLGWRRIPFYVIAQLTAIPVTKANWAPPFHPWP